MNYKVCRVHLIEFKSVTVRSCIVKPLSSLVLIAPIAGFGPVQ